jgi:methyl-accepting chemotaxis protein
MALVKKSVSATVPPTDGKAPAGTTREAEAERKKDRTMAKQQRAAERVCN